MIFQWLIKKLSSVTMPVYVVVEEKNNKSIVCLDQNLGNISARVAGIIVLNTKEAADFVAIRMSEHEKNKFISKKAYILF